MTTLSALKATIADDVLRSDLTTQIAAAITNAIEFFQADNFYFSETRSSTFVTVADQARYTVSDDADIPLFVKINDVFLTDSNGDIDPLARADPEEMEWLLDASAATGEPYQYSYYEQTFALYPVPDAVYTIRPMGIIQRAAPASDAESGNVWMTDAYELIRCRAKWYLYGHTIQDFDMAIAMGGQDGMGGATGAAYRRLKAETSRKARSDRIVPTAF